MIGYIQIKEDGTPKYQQIISGIYNAIENGALRINDKIPSINQMMQEFNLSQDTVLTAYNQLKSKGIISSVVGKGYFIRSDQTFQHHHVFLLFDNFTPYKEDLYNSINQGFGEGFSVDIYFHHDNRAIYEKLIADALGNYTAYIIMPMENPAMDDFLLNMLTGKNVYIVDKCSEKLRKRYPYVIQNYKQDVIKNMSRGLSRIKKYNRIRFINRSTRPHIIEIGSGLSTFALKYNFNYEDVNNSVGLKIENGDLFVVIEDQDLVTLIEHSEELGFVLGNEIGIISYNETQLKKVIANGITTVSTDFWLMGRTLAGMVVNKERGKIYNKSRLIIRNSI